LFALAALGTVSGPGLARAEEAGPPKAEAQAKGKAGHRGELMMERLAKELDLNEQQKAKVAEILKAHHQAMMERRKELAPKMKELHQQIREAQEAGEKEKAESLRAEARKIMEGQMDSAEKLRKDLAAVLSEEQTDKLMAHLRRAHARGLVAEHLKAAMSKLELTDDQKQAIRKTMADAKAEAAKAEGWEAKARIVTQAHGKIMSTVLTEEQRKKLEQMHEGFRQRVFDMLKMTDDQKAKAEAIMKQAFEEARKADDPKKKMEIIRSAHKKVFDEVLTDEQREQIKKHGDRTRQRPHGGPGQEG